MATAKEYLDKLKLYICKDFNDLLRLACTGNFLDEDEQKFPTREELEQEKPVPYLSFGKFHISMKLSF